MDCRRGNRTGVAGYGAHPGAEHDLLVSRSITQGRRAGLISLIGVALGFTVYLTATCLGLTAIFAYVPAAYTVLKLAGAAYLLWLAWKPSSPAAPPPSSRASSRSSRRASSSPWACSPAC